MRIVLYSLIALMLPTMALSAIKTREDTVQHGIFKKPGCKHDASAFANDCKCKADITRLQVVGGVEKSVAKRINTLLKKQIGDVKETQEEGTFDFCEGKPSNASREDNINSVERSMALVYEDAAVATFASRGYFYGAGAAHGLYGNTTLMVDLTTGEEFDVLTHLDDKQIAALNKAIKREIMNQYAKDIFEEEIKRTKPYVTKEGCEGCNLFYSGNGWEVEFQLYSIAPYSSGMITVVLPESVLPSPHTFMTGKSYVSR